MWRGPKTKIKQTNKKKQKLPDFEQLLSISDSFFLIYKKENDSSIIIRFEGDTLRNTHLTASGIT